MRALSQSRHVCCEWVSCLLAKDVRSPMLKSWEHPHPDLKASFVRIICLLCDCYGKVHLGEKSQLNWKPDSKCTDRGCLHGCAQHLSEVKEVRQE